MAAAVTATSCARRRGQSMCSPAHAASPPGSIHLVDPIPLEPAQCQVDERDLAARQEGRICGKRLQLGFM